MTKLLCKCSFTRQNWWSRRFRRGCDGQHGTIYSICSPATRRLWRLNIAIQLCSTFQKLLRTETERCRFMLANGWKKRSLLADDYASCIAIGQISFADEKTLEYSFEKSEILFLKVIDNIKMSAELKTRKREERIERLGSSVCTAVTCPSQHWK